MASSPPFSFFPPPSLSSQALARRQSKATRNKSAEPPLIRYKVKAPEPFLIRHKVKAPEPFLIRHKVKAPEPFLISGQSEESGTNEWILRRATRFAPPQPHRKMSVRQTRAKIRIMLQELGTNVKQNDNDPQGDGDQSPIDSTNSQLYRDLIATGGDIIYSVDGNVDVDSLLLSDFAKYCIGGNVEMVRKMISLANGSGDEDDVYEEGPFCPRRLLNPSADLVRLLETRETSMRLSPFLMLVAIGRDVPGAHKNDGVYENGVYTNINNLSDLAKKQIEVAEILVEYGARTNARDVYGKNVCHYGMGAKATPMTVRVARMCKERMCNKPDRLGDVCLLEVIQANREDVKSLLTEELGASIVTTNCDGCSPASLMGIKDPSAYYPEYTDEDITDEEIFAMLTTSIK